MCYHLPLWKLSNSTNHRFVLAVCEGFFSTSTPGRVALTLGTALATNMFAYSQVFHPHLPTGFYVALGALLVTSGFEYLSFHNPAVTG